MMQLRVEGLKTLPSRASEQETHLWSILFHNGRAIGHALAHA